MRVLVAAAAVVVALGVAIWALFFSSLLAVQTVEVHGLSTIDRQTVLDAADVDLGGPLTRLDTGAITTNLRAIPAIAHVAVTREWPHTVVLTVTERSPALAVPENGAYAIFDATGVRFRTTAQAPAGLAQLHTAKPPSAETVGDVLEVVTALPAGMAGRLTTVSADTLDSITLAFDGGTTTVVWGSAADSHHKADVLVALMKNPASVYDVSAPDVPTTRQ